MRLRWAQGRQGARTSRTEPRGQIVGMTPLPHAARTAASACAATRLPVGLPRLLFARRSCISRISVCLFDHSLSVPFSLLSAASNAPRFALGSLELLEPHAHRSSGGCRGAGHESPNSGAGEAVESEFHSRHTKRKNVRVYG
jgi:hypothetical protein